MTLGDIVGSLRRTLQRALLRKLADKTDRPWQQLLALYVVAHGEVRTQADLAERLLVDAPAASRLAALLEREGLLVRVPGPDRRCVCLRITARGRPHVRAFEDALRWLDDEAMRHLSPRDFTTLLGLMTRLQASVAGATEPMPARAPAKSRAPKGGTRTRVDARRGART